jgi:hypothetical protein
MTDIHPEMHSQAISSVDCQTRPWHWPSAAAQLDEEKTVSMLGDVETPTSELCSVVSACAERSKSFNAFAVSVMVVLADIRV